MAAIWRAIWCTEQINGIFCKGHGSVLISCFSLRAFEGSCLESPFFGKTQLQFLFLCPALRKSQGEMLVTRHPIWCPAWRVVVPGPFLELLSSCSCRSKGDGAALENWCKSLPWWWVNEYWTTYLSWGVTTGNCQRAQGILVADGLLRRD